ncbi:hypothetical protein NHH03_13280 [Stieleria sp. TO1_6]|uniref:hypothetical protein n=1 Tax=Stieleria tagensis TaxID=2956795 RepID=UPI00209B1B7B|nr:hypothetical protein [Stieleria tagensis]MCO8122714.1 hypothetical protein [Stieleria tagensis]
MVQREDQGLDALPTDATFKQRVELFWQWFPSVAGRFYETIEAGNCADLADEVSEFMGETMPGLAWVFGPGEDGGHSFTVSGEGQVAVQLLAEYWLSQAVELPGWTFYESRQPSAQTEGVSIEIGSLGRVDSESFLIRAAVDEEREVIDIVAWHPLFAELPEQHHAQLLFLLLDEVLGEFGTQTWLGGIDIAEVNASEVNGRTVFRLMELPTFIKGIQRYHGWEKHSPLRSYTGYTVREASPVLRGDTIAGTTCIPGLAFELIDEGGRLNEDPLQDTGASLAYLQIDGAVFPDGDQAAVRHNIEEALDEALEGQQLGRTLGGAAGTESSYIDLLLIDGDQSRAAVEQTMERLSLNDRYRWHSFA